MKIIENYCPKPIPLEEQNEVISVVVAIYNVAAYLDRAIISLINQTYQNLEIILVDDGSTDCCAEICDRYAAHDARIKVIHKENGGPSTSRNVGIENATGTYLAFLDGDDWVEEDMYEKMLSAIREYDVELAVCRYKLVYENRTKDISTGRAAIMEGQEMLAQYLEEDEAYQIQNAAWNKLYRRSLLGDLRFPARIHEDMLYTIQLLDKPSKSIYLDRAYYNYVCDRNTSIMNNIMNRGINEKTFTDSIQNLYDRSIFLRKIGRADLALLQDYFMYKRMLLFYTAISRSKIPYKKKYLKLLKNKLKEPDNKNYAAVFSIPQANPHEYQKLKIFLFSTRVYLLAMWLNDRIVVPIKTKKVKK